MKKLFSLLMLALLTLSAGAVDYVKVANNANLTSGTYLIVYEEGALAFNGGLDALDVTQNTIAVTITDGKIASDATVDAAAFTIDLNAGTIKSASGYYIGRTGDSNGMNTSAETAYANTISINADGEATIVAAGGAYLRYNATSGQERFRYFKSSTYTNQKAIALYLLEGSAPSITVAAPTLPAEQNFDNSFTVTITNNEAGADLYYSTDGLAWTPYTQPIVITETTTVYAKAEKNGVSSAIVSATYTKNEAGVTFTLVTNIADLADGNKIILVNNEAAQAMGASRGNNFGAVDVTINGTNITTSDANVITLEANGQNWNLKTNSGYLYAASSTSNQMKLENEVDTLGNANAAITINGDSAIIVFQGTNTRNVVRYNATNNPPLFSCYGETNNQKPVYIYKATSDVPEPPVTVADPVFNPGTSGFTGSVAVTITCATEGAQIYYSVNDGEYQPYTNAINVTEDSTVLKAYAELEGVQSLVVTAKYYKRAEVATIAAANALQNKKDFVFYGNVVVVYQNGSNLWVKDNTGYGLIYGSQVPEFAEGTTLAEEWEAQHYLFRGMIHEYQYPSNVTATEEPLVTIVPTEYAEADLTTDNINERVILKGLTLTAGEDPKYLYTADGMAIYNQFNITYPTIEEGKTYDVEGMVSYYNNAVQIMPIAVTETQAPQGLRGDVNGDQNVSIADVTALIDYLLSHDASNINLDNADCNLDEGISIADVTALIDYLLRHTW
jgi:hypothetical protein